MEKIKPIDGQTWARMDSLNDIRNEVMEMTTDKILNIVMEITTTKILSDIFNGKTVDDIKIIDLARNAVYETLRQAVYETLRQVVDIIDEHLICTYRNSPEIVYQTKGMPTGIRFLARTIVSLQQAINFYNNDPKLYLYIRHLVDTRDAFIDELKEQKGVDFVDTSDCDYLEIYMSDSETGETNYYSFCISSPESDKLHWHEDRVRGRACLKILDDIDDEFPEK